MALDCFGRDGFLVSVAAFRAGVAADSHFLDGRELCDRGHIVMHGGLDDISDAVIAIARGQYKVQLLYAGRVQRHRPGDHVAGKRAGGRALPEGHLHRE